jgi:hypothetical protein
VDAGSSPAGVLGHHLEDEIAAAFDDGLLPTGFRTFEISLQYTTESGAVPSDDGFGRDDGECLFPA